MTSKETHKTEKEKLEPPIIWKKSEHLKPAQKKLEEHREFIRVALYEEEITMNRCLHRLLKEKNCKVAPATLRSYVVNVMVPDYGEPKGKPRKRAAYNNLLRVKSQIEIALYEENLSYSEIIRNLATVKISVNLVTLINFIKEEIYSVRTSKPERYR